MGLYKGVKKLKVLLRKFLAEIATFFIALYIALIAHAAPDKEKRRYRQAENLVVCVGWGVQLYLPKRGASLKSGESNPTVRVQQILRSFWELYRNMRSSTSHHRP